MDTPFAESCHLAGRQGASADHRNLLYALGLKLFRYFGDRSAPKMSERVAAAGIREPRSDLARLVDPLGCTRNANTGPIRRPPCLRRAKFHGMSERRSWGLSTMWTGLFWRVPGHRFSEKVTNWSKWLFFSWMRPSECTHECTHKLYVGSGAVDRASGPSGAKPARRQNARWVMSLPAHP
jgi:hypothetical protein